MKEKVFIPENPFFDFMGRVADYVILNLLFAVTALPVITAGAAASTLLFVMKRMSAGKEGNVARIYMQEFIKNLRKTTGLWMVLFVAGVILTFDLWIAGDYMAAGLRPIFLITTGAMLFLWIMITLWSLQPDNSPDQRISCRLKKSFYKAVKYLPYTLLMMFVVLIPVFLYIFAFHIFAAAALPLYLCVGFSLTAAICSNTASKAETKAAWNYPDKTEWGKSMKQNQEVYLELTQRIIPFWKNMRDVQYGGYYGYMGNDRKVDPYAVKGCILNSRILWFFSNAYLLLGDETLLDEAGHAWRFLEEHCVDYEKGGVFWSVNYDGTAEDMTKHTYNQAFAVYALSSYYEASGEKKSLELAKKLYYLMELKCRDDRGYLEALDRNFEPVSNEKLSENGVMASRTMNTLLHVMEAYTELYRVSGEEYVADSLRWILDLFADKVYNPKLHRQEVFFDKDYRSLIDLHSYGHDIESSWLLSRTLEVLGDKEYAKLINPICEDLSREIYQTAFDGDSIANECENGVVDQDRVWWVQAEGIVGFLNSYQKNPVNVEYRKAAENIWKYIMNHIRDPREGSEWFWLVDVNGRPYQDKPLVDPWKCPYHNGRMCMEVLKRGIRI